MAWSTAPRDGARVAPKRPAHEPRLAAARRALVRFARQRARDPFQLRRGKAPHAVEVLDPLRGIHRVRGVGLVLQRHEVAEAVQHQRAQAPRGSLAVGLVAPEPGVQPERREDRHVREPALQGQRVGQRGGRQVDLRDDQQERHVALHLLGQPDLEEIERPVGAGRGRQVRAGERQRPRAQARLLREGRLQAGHGARDHGVEALRVAALDLHLHDAHDERVARRPLRGRRVIAAHPVVPGASRTAARAVGGGT